MKTWPVIKQPASNEIRDTFCIHAPGQFSLGLRLHLPLFHNQIRQNENGQATVMDLSLDQLGYMPGKIM